MEFNIDTATNEELSNELKKINANFASTQNEIKELLKRLELFSDAYKKISAALKNRGAMQKQENDMRNNVKTVKKRVY